MMIVGKWQAQAQAGAIDGSFIVLTSFIIFHKAFNDRLYSRFAHGVTLAFVKPKRVPSASLSAISKRIKFISRFGSNKSKDG